jgi:hypothetical protein
MDNGQAIDTTGKFAFPDGLKAFTGAPELVSLLSAAPRTHGCYVKHLAEFTLSRDIADRDRALIDGVEGQSMSNNASVKAMILSIVAHPSFLNRTAGVQ